VKRTIIILSLVVMMTGCYSIFKGKPKRTFPPDISGICWAALDQSKAHIEDCGTQLRATHNLTVRKVNGTKKVKGTWAWFYDGWGGIYVYGLCYGTAIEIGCNPQTGGEVSFNVLHHECGHYWLMTNTRERGHPEKYDKHFGWSWIDDYLDGKTIRSLKIVGDSPDGRQYHIDAYYFGEQRVFNMSWKDIEVILESGKKVE